MMTNVATLKPGFLVSLKTSLTGNISYRSEVIDAESLDETGALKAKWQTERTIQDPGEHARATKLRSKARNLVTGVCVSSAFGLLCAESNVDKLDSAIKAARDLADDFNASAMLSRVSVYVIVGRIASDDAEALRAVNSEMSALLDRMSSGIKNGDVKAIRDAANKARGIGQMLSDSARADVQTAIETARRAARKISKSGERSAIAVDMESMRKIASLRTAFLDFDETHAEEGKPADRDEARSIALDMDESPAIAIPEPTARAIEFE